MEMNFSQFIKQLDAKVYSFVYGKFDMKPEAGALSI